MKSLPKAARARTRRRLIAACAIALPLVAAPVAQAATCPTSKLVTAWAAAPADALAIGFTNQTIRTIIRPHTDGSSIRVRLSNRFGSRALSIGRATISVQTRGLGVTPGRTIDTESTRHLEFSGQTATSIPQGSDAWSDEIAVPPFTEDTTFAVDLYLPVFTGSATKHYRGYRTSYLSIPGAGDLAGKNTDLTTNFPASRETDEVYFVDGLEVRKPGNWGTVVAFGDSITDGTGSKVDQVPLFRASGEVDTDQRYPDFLQASLKSAGRNLTVANSGIAGNRLLYDGILSYAGKAARTRYVHDVLSQAGVTDVIISLGGNDFALGAYSINVINAYKQLIADLHAQGLNVIVATMAAAGDRTGFLIGNRRAALNEWITSTAMPHTRTTNDQAADGYFDFDTALTDPANYYSLNPAYNSGDWTHPDAEGYQHYVEQIVAAGGLAKLKGPSCT